MSESAYPADHRFAEAERTITDLQEKRARFQSRKVMNQAQLVDWLAKGLVLREELSEDEHIAIYGLSLADCEREANAWSALRQERGADASRDMLHQRIVENNPELQLTQ